MPCDNEEEIRQCDDSHRCQELRAANQSVTWQRAHCNRIGPKGVHAAVLRSLSRRNLNLSVCSLRRRLFGRVTEDARSEADQGLETME